MQTLAHIQGFDRAAKTALTPEELHDVLTGIATDPLSGDLIVGTGGLRKMRAAADQKGKSGGARVIYYYYDGVNPIYLITVFSKKDKGNITKAERNELAKLTAELKAALRAKLKK